MASEDFAALSRDLRSLGAAAEKTARTTAGGTARSFAAAVRRTPGHPAYRRVYRVLGSGVTVRPDPAGAVVTVSGGSAFRGGGTISGLAPAYEYGTPRGDARRGRRKGNRRGSQFPPPNGDGYWVGEALNRDGDRMAEQWAGELADEITRKW